MTHPHIITVARTTIVALTFSSMASVAAAQGVGVGDIVETNLNGSRVIGEVTRAAGAVADLNVGQNNRVPLLGVENMKVLQKAGVGGKSSCAVGEAVQVPMEQVLGRQARLWWHVRSCNGCRACACGRRIVRCGRSAAAAAGAHLLRRQDRGALFLLRGIRWFDHRIQIRQGNAEGSAIR